jgi:hypothetical protein
VEVEGLGPGEQVIIHPSDKIKDGVLTTKEDSPAE